MKVRRAYHYFSWVVSRGRERAQLLDALFGEISKLKKVCRMMLICSFVPYSFFGIYLLLDSKNNCIFNNIVLYEWCMFYFASTFLQSASTFLQSASTFLQFLRAFYLFASTFLHMHQHFYNFIYRWLYHYYDMIILYIYFL